jgi:hypothetical protein
VRAGLRLRDRFLQLYVNDVPLAGGVIEKYDLWTYPVECDNSPRAKSLIQFEKKEQGKMAAIVIMGIPVPWLQVHQSMQALRYGRQYGKGW